ncbi:hypothetical protein ACKJOL_05745 [Neisseria cinerea]|nr:MULTISPECIES: hypothetical protein [Neisseria]MBG9145182.1 hypothetical protein [Neisseria meningitidis]MBG9155629.1 hypothetical protein [Neisseria meningitidis]
MPSETRMQTAYRVSDGIARYGGFKQGFPLRRFGLPCLNLLRRNTFPFCL